MANRFYVIVDGSDAAEMLRDPQGLFPLMDGSVVICSVDDESMARSLAATEEKFTVRCHSDLTQVDQRRLRQEV